MSDENLPDVVGQEDSRIDVEDQGLKSDKRTVDCLSQAKKSSSKLVGVAKSAAVAREPVSESRQEDGEASETYHGACIDGSP